MNPFFGEEVIGRHGHADVRVSLLRRGWQPQEGAELLGKQAPEFEGLQWLNSDPLRLKDLRGKVVLIRFWLMGCPFCANTAPALNELYENYRKEGLVVIGVHHPRSEFARDAELVRRAAHHFGFF